ncbi:helix-turn-helix domain-containing protein [Cupriavidus sp. WGtm5]|uniref:helix-turn-helix domain-containing protein n=1 Tax=Cupriavidus TaxID=106589 RepID=UPI001F007611|nr:MULTISPECIES: helix-turn-helix domain-containing protein [Cupriavidus]MCO4890958.1 helix-turn-helix domain-containing protein [Cupriavidus sp. WGtm5]ULX55579.1 transcriptional regulator [Cupriavidus taiwanensis]
MTNIQFIQRDGRREFAVVPIEVWDRVKHLIEASDDVILFDAATEQDDGFRVPAAVLDAELAGDHPVKAWRNYRRLTQDALARAAGLSKPYLSQIENRSRAGSAEALRRLAQALDVPGDSLAESGA